MSMLLVHELHEARDRILVLKQGLLAACEREIPAYLPFLSKQVRLLDDALAGCGKTRLPLASARVQ